MSKSVTQFFLLVVVCIFVAACSTGPNSSPGGAVVLAVDAMIHRDAKMLVKATCGNQTDLADLKEIDAQMNRIAQGLSLDRDAKVSIGRTFKEDNGQKASVYFTLSQHGNIQQYLMKAQKQNNEWVAIVDSVSKSDKQLW